MKWEYYVFWFVQSDDLTSQLNELGLLGWELVSVSVERLDECGMFAYFKRPL